jgi:hypothetical protein
MQYSPGELSQLAFEAIISNAPNARELTDQAAAAYANNPQPAETRAITAIRMKNTAQAA